MILSKQDISYFLKNESEDYKLEGRVSFEDGKMIVNVQAYSKNNDYIGVCSYIYRNGGVCSKSIGDCNHTHVLHLEELLEQTLEFLILSFKLN